VESTTNSAVPPGWKAAVLVPLAMALVLMFVSWTLNDLPSQLKLTIIAGLFTNAAVIVLAVYWIVVKRLIVWGIAMLILTSTVLGFGLHTLLRTK
jgi:antibiotic biosynthesis monooxygenase (ABM) superfamily enzyme